MQKAWDSPYRSIRQRVLCFLRHITQSVYLCRESMKKIISDMYDSGTVSAGTCERVGHSSHTCFKFGTASHDVDDLLLSVLLDAQSVL